MTPAQLTTLLTDIGNNTATAPGTSGQIKDLAHTADNAFAVAAWYNLSPGTDYWVWSEALKESDVYDTLSDTGSTWNWATYKAQTVAEQGAWSKMFMGGDCQFHHLNNRVGVDAIFGGAAPGNAQRAHILAVGRRKATNAEKLLATAIAGAPANTGNDNVAGNRGKTTNPDFPAFFGKISPQDIISGWGI